jgi:hypothetical protein
MYLDFLYPAFLLLALTVPPAYAAKPKNAILLSEVRIPLPTPNSCCPLLAN